MNRIKNIMLSYNHIYTYPSVNLILMIYLLPHRCNREEKNVIKNFEKMNHQKV